MMGCSLSGQRPPTIEELFPDLSNTDPTASYKEMFKAYAEEFNNRRAENKEVT